MAQAPSYLPSTISCLRRLLPRLPSLAGCGSRVIRGSKPATTLLPHTTPPPAYRTFHLPPPPTPTAHYRRATPRRYLPAYHALHTRHCRMARATYYPFTLPERLAGALHARTPTHYTPTTTATAHAHARTPAARAAHHLDLPSFSCRHFTYLHTPLHTRHHTHTYTHRAPHLPPPPTHHRTHLQRACTRTHTPTQMWRWTLMWCRWVVISRCWSSRYTRTFRSVVACRTTPPPNTTSPYHTHAHCMHTRTALIPCYTPFTCTHAHTRTRTAT